MKIPNRFKLRGKTWHVIWVDQFSNPLQVGLCEFDACTITLARQYHCEPATAELLYRKFWHEVFHAVFWEYEEAHGVRKRIRGNDCVLAEFVARCVTEISTTAEMN